MIGNEAALLEAIRRAVQFAATSDWLVTLSIPPDRPTTDYGYIEQGKPCAEGICAVERFVEKPDAARAEQYLASGRFQWNSGMFVWRAATLLQEISRHLPELQEALDAHITRDVMNLEHYFAQAPNISIDYGVMERSKRVATIPVECGWSDIGSWEGLRRMVEREELSLNPAVKPYLKRYA